MTLELLEPMLHGGIRNTNFFNGRLLTAEDLRAEQQANRAQHQQLGQAIGAGVVEGLEVRLQSNGARPVLHVSQGLAITSKGAALALSEDVAVALVREAAPQPLNGDAGLFAVCRPEANTPSAAVARGVYIFTVAPASGYSERAPVVGFNGGGVASGCDNRFAVEGVKFNLVGVDLAQLTFIDAAARTSLVQLIAQTSPAGRSLLRNAVAHLCFGTPELASFPVDPFALPSGQSPLVSYGLVDWLRSRGDLNPCDVPLALVLWTTAGIEFVDTWAVRRRPHREARSSTWPVVTSDRRLAEGEAAFLQFQRQVADIVSSNLSAAQIGQVTAAGRFVYLPAVGVAPLATGARRGFNLERFFQGLTVRPPIHVGGAGLAPLLRSSYGYPPIDLSGGEVIWLYLVRENRQAIDATPTNPPQAYVVFSSGFMPYLGDGRFDLERYQYGNFG